MRKIARMTIPVLTLAAAALAAAPAEAKSCFKPRRASPSPRVLRTSKSTQHFCSLPTGASTSLG